MDILLHRVPELHNIYKKIHKEWGIACAEIYSESGMEILCGKGCFTCCTGKELYEIDTKRTLFSISIFGLEASNIKRKYNSLSNAQKKSVLKNHKKFLHPTKKYYYERCIFLDENNHCIIYGARPFLCRITGLPVRSSTHEYACDKYTDTSILINYNNCNNKPWATRWLKAIQDAGNKLAEINSFNKQLIYLPLSTFIEQIIK